jgi:hypothetical protein
MKTENKLEEEKLDDNFPKKKSHWEKYQIYYLAIGFFAIILLIFISNSILGSRIGDINKRLDGKKKYSFNSSSKLGDYQSRLENEPFPKNVKERLNEEIEKIRNTSSGSGEKENREEWINQVMNFP